MISQIQNNPDFDKLSPEAKAIVFDRLSADDKDFSALSPEAKQIVKQRLTGQAKTEVKSAEPLAPALLDRAKSGLAGTLSTPGLLGDMLMSPVRVVQHGLSKVTDSVPPPDYLGYSKGGTVS